MAEKAVRKRRTAEESRALILESAARRLREHGLDGLNITGVAEDAGLSHATLIHHFGSSGGMRDALADKMTLDLIQDLLAALEARATPAELIENVFAALSEGGHAKLLAWRAVEGSAEHRDLNLVAQLFRDLMRSAQQAFGYATAEEMRQVIFLVATTGLGYGLAGEVLGEVLGMSDGEMESFPAWVATHLSE